MFMRVVCMRVVVKVAFAITLGVDRVVAGRGLRNDTVFGQTKGKRFDLRISKICVTFARPFIPQTWPSLA